jgi:MSHA biogenesis protein MshJ
MSAGWNTLVARYAALNVRERGMVAAAVLLVVGMGGYSIWVDPPRARAAALRQQVAQQQQEVVTLNTQLAQLQASLTDPDAATKTALAEIKAQLATLDSERMAYDRVLVPPHRVPQLLQSLLARHRGLELVGMRTLEPVPLIERKKDADAKATTKAEPGGNIFKHGIEIKVAGSYADLLAYVAELERSPHKLLWHRISLAVKEYPRSELTLTVYTLSLDSAWLVV